MPGGGLRGGRDFGHLWAATGDKWCGESPENPHQFRAAPAPYQEGPAASFDARPILIFDFVPAPRGPSAAPGNWWVIGR